MYKYIVVIDSKKQVFLSSCTPPAQAWSNIAELLNSADVDKQNITLYLRQEEGPCIKIHPEQNIDVSESSDESDKTHEILGIKIADAYKVLRKKYLYLSPKQNKTTFFTEKLAELERTLSIIDSAVEGIEFKGKGVKMNDVHEVWLRKQYSPERCANALHVGKRTFYRLTHTLCIHLAYSLEMQMSPDEIHAFLIEGAKVKNWAEMLETFEELEPVY